MYANASWLFVAIRGYHDRVAIISDILTNRGYFFQISWLFVAIHAYYLSKSSAWLFWARGYFHFI